MRASSRAGGSGGAPGGGGGGLSPATLDPSSNLRLRAYVGATDGSSWITDELSGDDPAALGAAVAQRLLAAGAAEVLGRG